MRSHARASRTRRPDEQGVFVWSTDDIELGVISSHSDVSECAVHGIIYVQRTPIVFAGLVNEQRLSTSIDGECSQKCSKLKRLADCNDFTPAYQPPFLPLSALFLSLHMHQNVIISSQKRDYFVPTNCRQRYL